jgi:ammonium transporter, Amt family
MPRKAGNLRRLPSLLILLSLCLTSVAHAETPAPPQFSSADTAWLMLSSVLVLMMTIPGLALFYGGLVRRKNVLSVLMQSFILAAVVSIQWVVFGYSLAFSPGSAFMGSLGWLGLSGVSASEPFAGYSATVPHQAYMIYQCYVRDHHTGADYRRHCGADELQGFFAVQPAMDHIHL